MIKLFLIFDYLYNNIFFVITYSWLKFVLQIDAFLKLDIILLLFHVE